VLTLQQSDEIAAYILSLRGKDPEPYHSVALTDAAFEANGDEAPQPMENELVHGYRSL
jgi:hypothetical protein